MPGSFVDSIYGGTDDPRVNPLKRPAPYAPTPLDPSLLGRSQPAPAPPQLAPPSFLSMPSSDAPPTDTESPAPSSSVPAASDNSGSQRLIDVLLRDQAAGPETPKPLTGPWGWVQKIAAMTGAATTGYMNRNASVGMDAGRNIYEGGKDQAAESDRRFGQKIHGDQIAIEAEIQRENQAREERRDTAAGTERTENRKREERRDTTTAGWHKDEVQREKDRDAATEQHWKDQMALSQKELNERLAASKDSREGIGVLKTYVSDLGGRLNELDKRISTLQASPFTRSDPQAQQEIKDLQAERKARSGEFDEVNGMMRKHLKLGGNPQAPSAAGRPWSRAAWAQKHPGEDAAAAEAQAKSLGAKILP